MPASDASGRPALPISPRILDAMIERAIDLAGDDLDVESVAVVLGGGLLERGVDPVALALAALELAIEGSSAMSWRRLDAIRERRLAAQAEEAP